MSGGEATHTTPATVRSMKRLSLSGTWYLKYAAPIGFFAMLAFLWLQLPGETQEGRAWLIVALATLSVVGAVQAWITWPLADAVDDDGDALLVRRGRVQARVPFAAISAVEFRRGYFPTIRLHLAEPGAFGARIVFMPANAQAFTNDSALAAALSLRVVQARAREARPA